MTYTASAVPRLLACATSATLPQRDYRTTDAARGQERHAALELAAVRRDVASLPEAVRRMIRPSDRLLVEEVFGYDVAAGTARHFGPVPREAYATLRLGPFERLGKPDLVVLGTDGVIVVDYKGFEEVTPADRNTQLATYALMVARWLGVDEVTVVIVYEYRAPSIATLEALDLDAHASRLRQLELDVAAARGAPARFLATGPHCKYCPAFDACPLQQALAVDAETGLLAARVEELYPFADDREAAWALDLLEELKRLTTRIRAGLEVRAQARPIPLADGKLWGPRAKLGKLKLDGNIVHEIIAARHGLKLAEVAAPRQASQKAIREALEFAGADETMADVLDEIKARGGARKDTKTTIEAYEPGPRLVE